MGARDDEDLDFLIEITPYMSTHLDLTEFMSNCDFLTYEQKENFRTQCDNGISPQERVERILKYFIHEDGVKNKRKKLQKLMHQMGHKKLYYILERKCLPSKEEKTKKKINDKMPAICEQLKVEEVLIYLKSKDVLNEKDSDKIRAILSANGNYDAAFELIFRLNKREVNWYVRFLETLIETHQTQLAEEIDSDLSKKIQRCQTESPYMNDDSCCSSLSPRYYERCGTIMNDGVGASEKLSMPEVFCTSVNDKAGEAHTRENGKAMFTCRQYRISKEYKRREDFWRTLAKIKMQNFFGKAFELRAEHWRKFGLEVRNWSTIKRKKKSKQRAQISRCNKCILQQNTLESTQQSSPDPSLDTMKLSSLKYCYHKGNTLLTQDNGHGSNSLQPCPSHDHSLDFKQHTGICHLKETVSEQQTDSLNSLPPIPGQPHDCIPIHSLLLDPIHEKKIETVPQQSQFQENSFENASKICTLHEGTHRLLSSASKQKILTVDTKLKQLVLNSKDDENKIKSVSNLGHKTGTNAKLWQTPSFKEDLRQWQKKTTISGVYEKLRICKTNVLESVHSATSRQSFCWQNPVRVGFSGENEDAFSGSIEEFFRILMEEVKQLIGENGSLEHNLVKVERNDYFLCGRYIVWSILHCGQSCRFLSTKILGLLLGNDVALSVDDVTDHCAKQNIQQLSDAEEDVHIPSAWLNGLGIPPPFSVGKKHSLLQLAIKQFMYYRIHAEMQQFKDGLRSFGFLDAVRCYKAGLQSLLCPHVEIVALKRSRNDAQCNFSTDDRTYELDLMPASCDTLPKRKGSDEEEEESKFERMLGFWKQIDDTARSIKKQDQRT